MVSACPRSTIVLPRGSWDRTASMTFCTSAATAARSRPWTLAKTVEDRLHVVVIHVRRRHGAPQVHQVAQQLRRLLFCHALPHLGSG